MGPCRIDPFGDGAQEGICGATAETIVARNLLRHICSGTAAHSDHARDLVHAAARWPRRGLPRPTRSRVPTKLRRLAEEYGIAARRTSGRAKWPRTWRRLLLAEFGRQEGVLANTRRAPEQQQKNWTAEGATPRGIDREVVTGMHATHVGGDNDRGAHPHGRRADRPGRRLGRLDDRHRRLGRPLRRAAPARSPA